MSAVTSTGRLLRRVVRFACRRPTITAAVSAGFAVLGAAYAFRFLELRTSKLDLLPAGHRYAQLYRSYLADFRELDDMIIVVSGRTPSESIAYAPRLVTALQGDVKPLHRLAFRIDPERFEDRALLYLPTDQVEQLRNAILDHQEFLEAFAATPTLDQIMEGFNREIASAFVSTLFDLGLSKGTRAHDLSVLRDFLVQLREHLDGAHTYRSPWHGLFSIGTSAEEHAGYFFSRDGRLLFIFVTPDEERRSFTSDRTTIAAIRRQIAQLAGEFPGVEAGVTGAPALYNDELSAAFQDSKLATIWAVILTSALLLLAFHRFGKPALMLAVLSATLAWSLGVITSTVGHLTVFSVMFISIVVGIGIDYGIYFLFRYEEERRLGRPPQEALELTAERAGPGILLGAGTGTVTFYVLTLTAFRGIREFGFISGTSILLACLGMLTTFPALLLLVDRRTAVRPDAGRSGEETPRVPLLERLVRYPRFVLAVAGMLTVASLGAALMVRFDYNLLNLQAADTESVVWEKRILSTVHRSGVPAVATAASLGELEAKRQAFERLASVSEVRSVLLAIPEAEERKIAILRSVAPIVTELRLGLPGPVDVSRLVAALKTFTRRFDLAAGDARLPGSGSELLALRPLAHGLLERLEGRDQRLVEASLSALQSMVYRDFRERLQLLRRNVQAKPVTVMSLPEEIRRKFVGKSGRLLLEIQPKLDIWTRDGATTFVKELRSVDPEATGQPIIAYESIGLMEKAYKEGTFYALVFVATMVALMIRAPRAVIFALVPLVLGVLWTIGLMPGFGLRFNLANVWGISLILGAAAEFGVNLVLRYMESRVHGGPMFARSTVLGVVLNGLTTMAGFGSLLIAHHRGVASLGLLLTLGTAASLAASLVVLPVLLHRFGDGRRTRPSVASGSSVRLDREASRAQRTPHSR